MKPPIPIEPGRVVYSKAGRDAGRAMIVVRLDGAEYALVVDGRLRTIEKPKRKKNKHLAAKPVCIPSIQEKLTSNTAILNAEIRAALDDAGYGTTECTDQGGVTLGKE